MIEDVSAPVNALLADRSPEVKQEVWQGIIAAARDYATADGSLRMPSEAIFVTGQKEKK